MSTQPMTKAQGNTNTTNALADRLQPQSLDDLLEFSERIIESRLCPDHFEAASDIVLVAQQGAELGLNVMTALQNSHVIHGQVGWDADLMKALCMSTGEVEKWSYEEKSAERCAVTVQRAGYDPETFQWTKKKAQHIGLWSKGVWQSHPDTMLRHRVDADAARSVFPDVVAGVHTPSEIRESRQNGGSQTVQAEVVDHQGDEPESLDAAFEPGQEETKDLEPGQAESRQKGDGNPLASARRSWAQTLAHSDVPDELSEQYKQQIKQDGTYEYLQAMREERDALKGADDREAYIREKIGGGDGDWTLTGLEVERAEMSDAIDAIRQTAKSDDEVRAALKLLADRHDCGVPAIPADALAKVPDWSGGRMASLIDEATARFM